MDSGRKQARCIELANKGIKTTPELRAFALAAMADVVNDLIDPRVGNCARGLGHLAMRTAEAEYRLQSSISSERRDHIKLINATKGE